MQAVWGIQFVSMRKSALVYDNMAGRNFPQISRYLKFVRTAAVSEADGLSCKDKYILATVSAILLGIVFSTYGIYKIRNIGGYAHIPINPCPDNSLIDAGIKLDAKCRLLDAFSSLDICQEPDSGLKSTLFREKADAKVEPLHESAPSVVLKALVVLGQGSVCTLDIDGETSGKIFRIGDVFGGGRGIIAVIDSKGVEWEWLGQRYRTDF